MNSCQKCRRKYKYDPQKGHSRKECNSCISKTRKKKIKEYLVQQMGGKCERCGYNDCIEALCFHHVDPTTKLFEISRGLTKSMFALQKEVDKCALLCANCHIEAHIIIDEDFIK